MLVIALVECQEFTDQTYEGYTLYRVYPQNSQQVEKLRSLQTEQVRKQTNFDKNLWLLKN